MTSFFRQDESPMIRISIKSAVENNVTDLACGVSMVIILVFLFSKNKSSVAGCKNEKN